MSGEAIVTIRDRQWLVDLATTPQELVTGLGGLPSIPPGTGILFDLGAEQTITVTTVPMLFPIDIVFIGAGLVVTEVANNIGPGHLVTSEVPARFFLEVNAGEAVGVQPGDAVNVAVYQPAQAPSPIESLFPQLISLAATVMAFAFVVGMARSMSRALLPRPKPKAELYGPRGERLLPQTEERREVARWWDALSPSERYKVLKELDHPERRRYMTYRFAYLPSKEMIMLQHYYQGRVQLLPQTKRKGRYVIEQDRMGNIIITHTEQPGKSVFLQFEADKELVYDLLKRGERRDLDEGWKVEVKQTEPRASTLDELWEATAPPKTEQGPTEEELRYAEDMWEVTKEDAEKGETAGTYLWALINKYYPDNKEKQIRLMGFMDQAMTKYPKGIPREEAWSLARKWDVEKMLAIELTELLPQVKRLLPQTGERKTLAAFREMAEWLCKYRRPMPIRVIREMGTRHFGAGNEYTEFLLYLKSPEGLKQFRRELRDCMRRHGIQIPPEEEWLPLTELSHPRGKPIRGDVEVDSWVERDRIGIWVTDKRTGEVIAEWWDDDARQMFEDGFFKPGNIRQQKIVGKAFEESVLDYLEHIGVLEKQQGGGLSYLPGIRVMPRLPEEAHKDILFLEYIRDLVRLGEEVTDEEARLMWEAWKEQRLLPQTVAGTKLDSLQIVRAYKQVSRHGEDKISVDLQAWAIFPRGRRPHLITMYRSGDEYVIHPLYAHVERWAHVPVSRVRAWIKSLPVRHFEAMAVAPEFREEAERLAREVDEPLAVLSLPSRVAQRSPRLLGPRERRELPEELEFFADSPDHIGHSMDRNGLRPQLEEAFREAIERARKAYGIYEAMEGLT